MFKILIVLSLFMFVSCGNKQNNIEKQTDNVKENGKKTDSIKQNNDIKQTNPYQLKDYQVIIKPSDKEFKDILGDKYKSRTPEVSEIETAEKLLYQGFVDQARGTVNRLLYRTLDQYYRQFVGATDSNGNKIIWINCFRSPDVDYDWKHYLILEKGGGNSFFNLKANITKNTYTDFFVNGNK
jgi:hypothetical protein